jgi:hypothetical protein
MLELIEHATVEPSGNISRERSLELNPEYDQLYHKLYPGYATPSAAVLALVAVGEGCRDSALEASSSAASTAAEAMASFSAAPVDDTHYDEVHESTFRRERQTQFEILMHLLPKK